MSQTSHKKIERFIKKIDKQVEKSPPNFDTRIWFTEALCSCKRHKLDWPENDPLQESYIPVAHKFRKLWGDLDPNGNTLPMTEDQFAEIMACIAERDDSSSETSESDSESDCECNSESDRD